MDNQPIPLRPDSADRVLPATFDTLPEVASAELMRGGRELLIRHGESTYRLRVTMSGKLILTK
jgi:hemin uptake protein HemP